MKRAKQRTAANAASLHRAGIAQFRRGDRTAAIASLAAASRLAPRDAAVREAHAELLARAHRWSEAAAEADAALACGPEGASLLDLLGRIALEQGAHTAAIEHFGASLAARPAHAGTLVNLAVALHRVGEWSAAVQAGEAALRMEPSSVPARLGLSLALHALGRRSEALAVLRPVRRHPMARFNEGFVRAHEGDLATALPLMEARLEVRDPGAEWAPRWDGDSLDGTLLVVPEQGLGDALLMCGWLPALARRAREVVLWSPAPLARLFAVAFPAMRVVTDPSGVRAEAQVSVMSLAMHARARSRADYPAAPWLRVPVPAQPRGPRPRVGINWAGNPRYALDPIRSTSLATLAPLLADTNVEWVSLHKGEREHEAVVAGLPSPLVDAVDFLDTAQVVAGLDLVVSTETAIPNLAAALGVPTVVLTHPTPDWRWSHAYSGVVVAAQTEVGDWSRPVAIALDQIRTLTAVRAAA